MIYDFPGKSYIRDIYGKFFCFDNLLLLGRKTDKIQRVFYILLEVSLFLMLMNSYVELVMLVICSIYIHSSCVVAILRIQGTV